MVYQYRASEDKMLPVAMKVIEQSLWSLNMIYRIANDYEDRMEATDLVSIAPNISVRSSTGGWGNHFTFRIAKAGCKKCEWQKIKEGRCAPYYFFGYPHGKDTYEDWKIINIHVFRDKLAELGGEEKVGIKRNADTDNPFWCFNYTDFDQTEGFVVDSKRKFERRAMPPLALPVAA